MRLFFSNHSIPTTSGVCAKLDDNGATQGAGGGVGIRDGRGGHTGGSTEAPGSSPCCGDPSSISDGAMC